MLATPQSVTVNTVAISLHRVIDESTASTYKSADGSLQLRVSHQETKTRTRRMARLDQTDIAADPLTAENQYQKAGVYIVIDEPNWGFSDADLGYLVEALKTWLTADHIAAMLSSRH